MCNEREPARLWESIYNQCVERALLYATRLISRVGACSMRVSSVAEFKFGELGAAKHRTLNANQERESYVLVWKWTTIVHEH